MADFRVTVFAEITYTISVFLEDEDIQDAEDWEIDDLIADGVRDYLLENGIPDDYDLDSETIDEWVQVEV